MNNITLDTTNFSEQLGLYDFFDVIVSGAVFVFGLSVLSKAIYSFFWIDTTLVKGLGIVLFIYIAGVVLQEIGSMLDRHFIGIKNFTRSTFLFDIDNISIWKKLKYWYTTMHKKEDTEQQNNVGEATKKSTQGTNADVTEKAESDTCFSKTTEKWNWVLSNKTLLIHYRNLAKQIFEECFPDEKLNERMYNDEKFNSFVFSIIQYHVSCLGKDKKVEKLRALYSLARTLMVCFSIFVIFFLCVNLFGWFSTCLDPRLDQFTVLFAAGSFLLAILFFFRMKKCKKYMALILLGNYDASLRTSKEKTPCYKIVTYEKSTYSEVCEEIKA